MATAGTGAGAGDGHGVLARTDVHGRPDPPGHAHPATTSADLPGHPDDRPAAAIVPTLQQCQQDHGGTIHPAILVRHADQHAADQ